MSYPNYYKPPPIGYPLLKDRRTLYVTLGIVMICVFTLTVVYAALNTVLKITGNAEIVISNWDIKLANKNQYLN